MHERKLGNSPLDVSAPGLGCMTADLDLSRDDLDQINEEVSKIQIQIQIQGGRLPEAALTMTGAELVGRP